MNDTPALTPIIRATAVFEAAPEPELRCSHCHSAITDDDAECPACDSPIDWGASFAALDAWQQSVAGDPPAGSPR